MKKEWNNKAETVQLLGRWQPWHAGHQALFEKALEKTGQVVIQIRDVQGWNNSNPFDVDQVESNIHAALKEKYEGCYKVMVVPNITNISYGRDVGYSIEKIELTDELHAISATKIRKEQGLK
jgi:nicotinamide mononucleotide adenylyltransferase